MAILNFDSVCEMLKHVKVDVNVSDDKGLATFISASRNGNFGVVAELLKHDNVDVMPVMTMVHSLLLGEPQRPWDCCSRVLKHDDVDDNDVVFMVTNPSCGWSCELLKCNKAGSTALGLDQSREMFEIVSSLEVHGKSRMRHEPKGGEFAVAKKISIGGFK
jgi:hypothetical protein